ncbi:hypothetical protein rutana_118 [Salmonella phage rutana]|uniref:Uncharacterized protein n=17 Tax=Caudoviricetes TaxID=2731619 RepID=A0A7G8ANZ9_9CAUD|nr:hypothetical protein HOS37_gp160 [Escherichia phage saus132]YP_009858006.1 hypothetical protein HWD22_gp137 [Salmonella phage bombadil]YP_009858332.1 hypothetical protein HWD24_gp144 [Salmonella phage rokbiter]YP_009858828.1 hypothetical protein HWD27_gp147 [Salmonella phage oselot]ASU02419.1 hypothetical protein P1301_0056 [Bacteriophage T5-like chee130_1]ASU02724.1 hypothetical protein P149_0053 [Bacteriophage T5-like poul149]ASU02879.1 hypothetical protein P158_0055 [Bacteriophage T5-li
MKVKIMMLDLANDKFFLRHTFPSKQALEFHIKYAMGMKLPEREIFDKACDAGVIYVWQTTYHDNPEDLRKEVEQILEDRT